MWFNCIIQGYKFKRKKNIAFHWTSHLKGHCQWFRGLHDNPKLSGAPKAAAAEEVAYWVCTAWKQLILLAETPAPSPFCIPPSVYTSSLSIFDAWQLDSRISILQLSNRINMPSLFSKTVTRVKPYGNLKVVRAAKCCTSEAPSVKKKKKKNYIPNTWKLWQEHTSLSARGTESQLVGAFHLSLTAEKLSQNIRYV